MYQDHLRVPGNDNEASNLREGSVCLDDRLSQDDCCLSFNIENNGMDVDNEGGSYACFGHAHSVEPNEMIGWCVELDGNNSVG